MNLEEEIILGQRVPAAAATMSNQGEKEAGTTRRAETVAIGATTLENALAK